jgi:hypothetical protein
MFHRILNAAQGIIIDQISGGPNDKKVTDALIEDYFGRSPRIRASHNDGKRMLRLRSGGAALSHRLARAHLALSESLVPSLQTAESLIGRDRWSGGIGSYRQASESDDRQRRENRGI